MTVWGKYLSSVVRSVALAGANWDNSSHCSSRSRNGNNSVSNTNVNNGGRGSKIAVDKLINKKIIFCDFRVSPSQFRRFGDEVTMVQIVLDGEKHIFFTQSKHVTTVLKQFKDKLPRCGTLYKDDRALKIK